MREIRQSGSEGGGTKPIASPYPYQKIHDAIRATATRITLDYRRELDKILVTRGCYAGAQSPT